MDVTLDKPEDCLKKLEQCIALSADHGEVIRCAVALVLCDDFEKQDLQWQIAAFSTIFKALISTLNMQSGAVASLAAPHFRRLLRNPETDIADACRLHDIMWGLWWCAAASFDDMRAIYPDVCLPFHEFMRQRGQVSTPTTPIGRPTDGHQPPMRVAYLLHYAHGAQGNALAPIVISLAKAHAKIADRKIFVYAVQWVDRTWLTDSFRDSEVTVRVFDQNNDYNQIDDMVDQLRSDRIDVILSEVTSSITALIFARRAAALQARLDLGLPYWIYPEVDLVFLSGKPWRDCYPYEKDRTREFHAAQEKDLVFRTPDWVEVRRVRSEFAAHDLLFGVFTRLIKITPAYLNLIGTVLSRHPRAHFVIGGTGDPRLVDEFLQTPSLRGRVTFIHRNVDLAVYGNVLAFFVDTFPFIGGVACREVVAQGLPVFSLRSNEWSLKQEQERDPASVARNETDLLALIDRAIVDPAFRRQRAAGAAASMSKITAVEASAREIDDGLTSWMEDQAERAN